MSQIRNNQVGPSPATTTAPPSVPPQVGGSAPVQGNGQPGYIPPGQTPPPPIIWIQVGGNRPNSSQFDDQSESENPCRLCCDIRTAASFFIVMNLGYCFFKLLLFLEVEFAFFFVVFFLVIITLPVEILSPSRSGGFGFPLHPFCFMLPFPLPSSTRRDSEDSFVYVNVLMSLIWFGDLITTVALLSAVLCKMEKVETIILINIFMWYNLCYPGILFHLVFYIGFAQKSCDGKYLPYWILAFAVLIAWVVCSGLVAKAYKNAVKRALPEQDPDRGLRPTAGANVEGERTS